MIDLSRVQEFEWDTGNTDKSFRKHGITPGESEEIFLDQHLLVLDDLKHSQEEPRYIALGRTFEKKTLFLVFTLRANKIKIISARKANKKERGIYEKELKKNPPF